MDPYIKIVIFFILLLFSGFFSSSEVSFFSLNKVMLKRKKLRNSPKFKYIVDLLKTPASFLKTVLIGNELINSALSVVSASICYAFLSSSTMIDDRWLPVVAVSITLPMLLIFGEILPKTLAVKFPEKVSFLNSYPLYLFSKTVTPARFLLGKVSMFFIGFFVKDISKQPAGALKIDEDTFKSIVDISSRDGTIEQEERDLIHRVFHLDDIDISKIMTKRERISALPKTCSVEEIFRVITEEKFSRYPVFDGTIDNIIGFVHVKDLLKIKDRKKFTMKSILRRVVFVEQERNAFSVFFQFQRNKNHLGIVIDDQEKTVGLVSLEDILEELFGEIMDETDVEDFKA